MKTRGLEVLVLLFAVVGGSGRVLAQGTNWDYGVVSELLGSATNAITQIERDDELRQSYEMLLVEQEITAEAIRRGLGERWEVRKVIEKVRRDALVRALRDEVNRGVAEPSDAEVRTGYERGKETVFSQPPRYTLDAIQLDRRDAVMLQKARTLETGKPVLDSQVNEIQGKSIVTLTSQQWVTQDFVAPDIWKALPGMKEGEVRVFDVDMGVYLIRRGSFRDKEPAALAEIRETVKQMVWAEKRQAAWENVLIETRQRIGLPAVPAPVSPKK
jgi:hypothetical protein